MLSSAAPASNDQGPEAQDLISRATGCVVFDNPVAGINAIGVRDVRKTVVRKPDEAHNALRFVAGPDADGWVVFVDYNMESKTHCMLRIKMDGTGQETIFCRPGDALWDNPMSTPVLAPKGGNIAFLTQPYKPFAPIIVSGPIDVWNIQTKAEHAINVKALSQGGLSWFSDGRRLTYVRADKPEAVYVLDVDSGKQKFIHEGKAAMVSTDGTSLLIGTDTAVFVTDVSAGGWRQVDWPGKWGGPIAFIGSNLLLYWGLPTTGGEPQYTVNNTPLVGPKPMGTLKLAELSSGKFQTVMPYVDPRREVSFGVASSCP